MTDTSLEGYLDDFDDNGDIDEFIANIDQTPGIDDGTGLSFRIDSDDVAAWAMRKLRRLRRQQASNDQIANDEHDRITAWQTRVNRPLTDRARFFEGVLTDYAIRCRATDDRKTIDLPAGKVSTRLGSPKWDIDGETFIPWAEQFAPSLLRVKTEPALADVKASFVDSIKQHGKAITDSGEVVPGITVNTDVPMSVTITTDLD
jgi:hypothetical protein